MARTKSSRGAAPFQLRSGNSPMSLFGLGGTKVGKFFNKIASKTPIVQGINALKGGGGGNEGGSIGERLTRIEEKIDAGSETEGLNAAATAAKKAKKAAGGGIIGNIMDTTRGQDGGDEEEILQADV